MDEVELLYIIERALRELEHSKIIEVSADGGNDGELIVDTRDGVRFIIHSKDIDVEDVVDDEAVEE